MEPPGMEQISNKEAECVPFYF